MVVDILEAEMSEPVFSDLDKWRLNLIKAVEAQANDETLWCANIPGEEFLVTVGEAYLQQALRNLHRVIEENDLKALQEIINQSNGDV
jgi:hypothetical protein